MDKIALSRMSQMVEQADDKNHWMSNEEWETGIREG